MRTHIILSDSLVEEIDNLVGRRKRSRFVEAAITEKLRRGAMLNALKETAGILLTKEHPEWDTSMKVADWVKESRQRDLKRLKRDRHG